MHINVYVKKLLHKIIEINLKFGVKKNKVMSLKRVFLLWSEIKNDNENHILLFFFTSMTINN